MNRLDKERFIKEHLHYINRKILEDIVHDLINDLSDESLDTHLLEIIENYYNLDLEEILGDKENE